MACPSAEAVTAAGPRTTVAAAQTTTQGPRTPFAQPPARSGCPVFSRRLNFMIPTSGQCVRPMLGGSALRRL
ncbi:hypothetical protein [Streptomyces sp. NPDC055109]